MLTRGAHLKCADAIRGAESVSTTPDPVLEAMRAMCEDALTVPTGKLVRNGMTHRVSYLPHDLAREAIRRIDAGESQEPLLRWFYDEMPTRSRWSHVVKWARGLR